MTMNYLGRMVCGFSVKKQKLTKHKNVNRNKNKYSFQRYKGS